MVAPQGAFDGEQQGRFFSSFPGATPKFALNRGPRRSEFVETMARIIVDVPPEMLQTLIQSLPADTAAAARTLLYTGDITQLINGAGTGTGYFDFLLTQVTQQQQEREQVVDTLTDNTVIFYSGQSAPVFSCGGTFLNTYQDDQNVWFQLLYSDLLRGTQLARRGLVARLKYDSFFITGYLMNLQVATVGGTKNAVEFSFNFRAKQIQIATPILYNPSQARSLLEGNLFVSPSPRGSDNQTRHGLEAAERPAAPSALPAASTLPSNVDERAQAADNGLPPGTAQLNVDTAIVEESQRAAAALPEDPTQRQTIVEASTPIIPAGGDVRQQLPADDAATFQTFGTVNTTPPVSSVDPLVRIERQIALELSRTDTRGSTLISPVTGAEQRSGTYADTIGRAPVVTRTVPIVEAPRGSADTAISQDLDEVYGASPELLAEIQRVSSQQQNGTTLPRSRQRATG